MGEGSPLCLLLALHVDLGLQVSAFTNRAHVTRDTVPDHRKIESEGKFAVTRFERNLIALDLAFRDFVAVALVRARMKKLPGSGRNTSVATASPRPRIGRGTQ